MAKAKRVAVTDTSANASAWAAEVLRTRFGEVVSLRDAALKAKDIEDVHRMRVAIRRLRSALHDFAPLFNKNSFAESSKGLKTLADALGKARDTDVALAALVNLREKAREKYVRRYIERKIDKRNAKREVLQTKLEAVLDETVIENLREVFQTELAAAETAAEKAKNITILANAREVITKSLQEFVELSPSLYRPFDNEALHELRIAAKRLRYAMELYTVCWGARILPFADEIAAMQTYLGEVHDEDLWIEGISRRLNSSKGSKKLAELWLLSHFIRERTRNYRAALGIWSRWQEKGFIKRLQALTDTADDAKNA